MNQKTGVDNQKTGADNQKTGADSLLETLMEAGIDRCFANPGTSEMSLVEAIDRSPNMHPTLCLFEGVCTGAADGFARVSGRPACTLLHLGPGLANGIANLHNARRAGTPILNLVGDHPRDHLGYDTPLTSDIVTLAKNYSCWVGTAASPANLGQDAARAIQAMQTYNRGSEGQIATLIIPADCAWGETDSEPELLFAPVRAQAPADRIAHIASTLDSNSLILLGDRALTPASLWAAAAISKQQGCRFAVHTFPAAIPLAPWLPSTPRLPYFPEQVRAALGDLSHLVLAGAEAPASFFAYQDKPSLLVPEATQVHYLAEKHQDASTALIALAEYLECPMPKSPGRFRPDLPTGKLSAQTISQSIAAQIPEKSNVSVDSGGGWAAFEPLQKAAEVLWMSVAGGAIGQAGPVATGAALATRSRRTFALIGDGAAAYTLQCLWTQARENLNVTTVIYNNSRYQILATEYQRMGNESAGERASSLFELDRPKLDWVSLAKGFGVPAVRANSTKKFNSALAESIATPGPMLIDAVLGS